MRWAVFFPWGMLLPAAALLPAGVFAGGGHLSPQPPSVYEVLTDASQSIVIIWAICAVCTALSLVRWWTHRRAVLSVPHSARRQFTLHLILLGPIFAITTFLPLFFVRAQLLFDVVRTFQEAWAIHVFAQLLLDLLGGRRAAEEALYRLPPAKFVTVAPLCCLCSSCAQPRPFTGRLLQRSLWMAEQFFFVVPSCAIANVFLAMEAGGTSSALTDGIQLALAALQAVSLTLAMYGLFIIFLAVRHLLTPYKPELKLAVIKVIVIVGTIQGIIISVSIAKADGQASDGNLFQHDYAQEFWRNWLLNVETLPFTFLLFKAFPVAELREMGHVHGLSDRAPLLADRLPETNGGYGTPVILDGDHTQPGSSGV